LKKLQEKKRGGQCSNFWLLWDRDNFFLTVHFALKIFIFFLSVQSNDDIGIQKSNHKKSRLLYKEVRNEHEQSFNNSKYNGFYRYIYVHRESKYAIEMIALIMSEIFNDTF